MKISRRFRLFYILLCCALFLNNVSAQSATPEAPVAAPAEENLIHAGDLIDIDIVGSTEFDWRGNLTSDGFLSNVNFSDNPIYALCETEEAVAAKVIRSYGKILRDPKAVVKILDRSARPLAVLYGAVKKNQRFQIKRPVSLSEIIIISGGFTEQVSGEIQIYRPANLNCSEKNVDANTVGSSAIERFTNIKISDLLSGDARFNPQIISGDVITVAEAKPLYVTGAVAAPKQIAVRAKLSVTRAIDSAGGLSKDAAASEIRIFRRNGIETKSIVVDLNKIKAGQAEDIDLQPFDVVDVPRVKSSQENFAPVVREFLESEKRAEKLPLTIID